MSWRIPCRAITEELAVIMLIKPLESEKQMRSLMLREMAALIASLSAKASATSAEATKGQATAPCDRVSPAALVKVHPMPPAEEAPFHAASE